MAEYQGHRSWNAWNVALWIGSKEHLYRLAMEAIEMGKASAARKAIAKGQGQAPMANPPRWSHHAAAYFVRRCFCLGERTPDGAVYNRLSIRLALEGLAE